MTCFFLVDVLGYFNTNFQNRYTSVFNNIVYITSIGIKVKDMIHYFKYINHNTGVLQRWKIRNCYMKTVRNLKRYTSYLGSIVVFITQNLDSYDVEKDDKIMEALRIIKTRW